MLFKNWYYTVESIATILLVFMQISLAILMQNRVGKFAYGEDDQASI